MVQLPHCRLDDPADEVLGHRVLVLKAELLPEGVYRVGDGILLSGEHLVEAHRVRALKREGHLEVVSGEPSGEVQQHVPYLRVHDERHLAGVQLHPWIGDDRHAFPHLVVAVGERLLME